MLGFGNEIIARSIDRSIEKGEVTFERKKGEITFERKKTDPKY